MFENLVPEIKAMLLNYSKPDTDKNVENVLFVWNNYLDSETVSVSEDQLSKAIAKIILDDKIRYFPTVAQLLGYVQRDKPRNTTYYSVDCSKCDSSGMINVWIFGYRFVFYCKCENGKKYDTQLRFDCESCHFYTEEVLNRIVWRHCTVTAENQFDYQKPCNFVSERFRGRLKLVSSKP